MPQNNRPIIIGITGNIGSGKSYFSNKLTERGFNVYYADIIANQRLEDPEVIDILTKRYSIKALCDDNNLTGINKHKLAEIVFNNKNELAFINSLLHPLVLKDMQEIVENFELHEDHPFSVSNVIVFEVPLLFEAGLAACFDYIILVCASHEVRLKRLAAKGESVTNIKKRIENQMDDSVKMDKVDLVVDNNGSKQNLLNAVESFMGVLSSIPKRDIFPFHNNKAINV